MDPTLANLLALLDDFLVVSPGTAKPSDTFAKLAVDSLDHIQLITQVEDLFEVEIPDPEAEACNSVMSLYHAILTAQNRISPPPTDH